MNSSKRVPALAAAIFTCFYLTGCEKTMQLHAQAAELDAKVLALQDERRTLETQIEALRPSLPLAGSPDEGARILYSQATGELTLLEPNLKTAAASLKETEAAVTALRQEVAAQRPKAQ